MPGKYQDSPLTLEGEPVEDDTVEESQLPREVSGNKYLRAATFVDIFLKVTVAPC